MNLKNLPKALIPFHRLGNHALVPLEEHFRESIHYLRTGDRTTRIHFTVLPEHEKGFRECFESIRLPYEQAGCPLEMELSRQDPSTDAVALDLSGNPLRDSRGDLVFRPSGHGALLNNLEKAAERCDIAFVKNIDNVLPDALKSETILYAKALTGTLIELEQEVHHALARLDPESGDSPPYADILELARDRFGTPVPRRWADFSREERRGFLRDALDRPLRVCALVPARGETGGLPFWVREEDGRLVSQIVESAQMDLENPAVRDMVQSATHFNPVFMALALKNREGKPFSLSRFAEPRAGIVTKKNHDRLECRALEAPGLWNGGMHHWNTLFVEAPREIFAPVKTVMDLLNDQHRGRS
jgi:hypothetical protein